MHTRIWHQIEVWHLITFLLVAQLLFLGFHTGNQDLNQQKRAIGTEQLNDTINKINTKADRNGNITLGAINSVNILANKTISNIQANNQLIKFLTDNFGAQSGYLERENFQYSQENQTADFIKEMKANQLVELQNHKDLMVKLDTLKGLLNSTIKNNSYD